MHVESLEQVLWLHMSLFKQWSRPETSLQAFFQKLAQVIRLNQANTTKVKGPLVSVTSDILSLLEPPLTQG